MALGLDPLQNEKYVKQATLLINGTRAEDVNKIERILGKKIVKHIINLQDENGNTALHYAAKLCNKTIIAKLLDQGAHTYIVNCKGEIAYHLIPTNRKDAAILFF